MTGAVYFPNNAGIVQNQNSSSNWTEAIKWYKGGVSQNTYNPSVAHHNTGGTGGAMTLLPYATATDPWNSNVGLYLTKNRLRLDGIDIYPIALQSSNPSRCTCWFNTGTRV